MKSLAWLLVLANVAFLGWQLRNPAPGRETVAEPAPIGAADNVNRLLLLAEVGPDEIRPRALTSRETTLAPPATRAPAERATPTPAAAPEPALAPALDPGARADASPVGGTTPLASSPFTGSGPASPTLAERSFEPVDSSPSAPTIASPPEPRSASTPALAAAGRPPGPADAVSAAPPELPEPLPRACFSVGPLEEDAQIADVRAFLEAEGGDPMLREDERREIAAWWIYFPPLPSREEAAERVVRMKADGIEDVLAIPRGDMANAVSLGLYSRRDGLERRIRQLRAKGYAPSITPRYRTRKASWLDVEFPGGGGITPEGLATRFPGLDLEVLPCTGGRVAGAGGLTYNADGPAARGYARSGL